MNDGSLGERIRMLRDSQELSLTEAAGRAQMSKAYLSQLEHGTSRQPSYEVLRRLATVLGVSVSDLVGEPAVWDPTELGEVPTSLKAFAKRSELPDTDVQMLARIHYRGRQPAEPEDWAHLYETIKRTVQ